MDIGTIIKIKFNINNYPQKDGVNWQYTYFKLCNGKFAVYNPPDGLIGEFEGKHFICQGSTFYHNLKGMVYGLELLNKDFEIVKEIPKNIIS